MLVHFDILVTQYEVDADAVGDDNMKIEEVHVRFEKSTVVFCCGTCQEQKFMGFVISEGEDTHVCCGAVM